MQIGVHPVSVATADGSAGIATLLRRIAAASDAAGCSHLLLMDHYFQLPFVGDVHEPVPEAYTTCGFLAACSERVRLGLLVSGVTYRHPGLLVKIATTLDVLSGGRALLALGAAWYEREHHGLGVPFPALSERFERLEETLQIAHQMWSDDDGPFEGRHYHLAETICAPAPVQHPRPPILVGGGGERKTLRLVARYADASNLIASSRDEVVHKLDVLRRHCDAEGRDPAEITRTLLVTHDVFADLPAFLDDLAFYAEQDVAAVITVPPPASDPVAFIERLGTEVVPVAVGL